MDSLKSIWKKRLDNFLVFNLFVVIAGAFLLVISFVAQANGSEYLLKLFQRLWYPLFIPAFSLFFTAVLLEACITWFNRKDGP